MKFLSFSALLILISCAAGPSRKDLEETGYRSSGVEQFFLAELPAWSNFSAPAMCFKRNSIHYLDFSKLVSTYQLTYPQMIELQAQYNDRLENYFRSTAVKFLKPVEQASFFSNSLEQVRGGVKVLKLPQVAEVEIVWLEGSKPEEIVKLAKSGRFDQRLPILFSSCHSRSTLGQWVSEHGLDDVGFYLLSAEWLSAYSFKGQAIPGLQVDLGALFGQNIKYKFFSSQNKQTTEILLPQ